MDNVVFCFALGGDEQNKVENLLASQEMEVTQGAVMEGLVILQILLEGIPASQFAGCVILGWVPF